MEEPYTEGVAIHGGPEPCVDDPQGRGEALVGVRAGWTIEPRNHSQSGCRRCRHSGRQHRQQRYREPLADPARSKTPSMYGASVRENREIPRSPVWVITGQAAQGTPRR